MRASDMTLMDLTRPERKAVRDAMKNGKQVSQPSLRPVVTANARASIERVKKQQGSLRRSRILFAWIGAPIMTAAAMVLLVTGSIGWRILGVLDLLIVIALLSAAPLAVNAMERSRQRYETSLRENS